MIIGGSGGDDGFRGRRGTRSDTGVLSLGGRGCWRLGEEVEGDDTGGSGGGGGGVGDLSLSLGDFG